jgi:hypothetical protein
VTITPIVLQPRLYEAGYWPCDRCGESPWPQQVKLTEDGYRCEPCRGIVRNTLARLAPKATPPVPAHRRPAA